MRIDRGTITFLGPGGGGVAGAQARLDMGDRDSAIEPGLGGAERTGSVALDNKQPGRRRESAEQGPPHPGDMRVGLGKAGAIKFQARILLEAVIRGVEARMLPGQDDQAVESAPVERGGDGG